MTLDGIYKVIGQHLFDHAQEDFLELKLYIEKNVGSTGLEAQYLSLEKEVISLRLTFSLDVIEAIDELHLITTSEGLSKWNRAIFVLFPDHEFEIEFIWDQELYDEIVSLEGEG